MVRYVNASSKHTFEILKPSNIELLLAIHTVIRKRPQELVIHLTLLLQKSINRIKQLIRNGLQLRTSISVGIEQIHSMLLRRLVVFSKIDVSYLKTLGHNCVDYHGLIWTRLSDADSHLVHVSFVGMLLLLLVGILTLLSLIKVRWGFNIREQSDSILACVFG